MAVTVVVFVMVTAVVAAMSQPDRDSALLARSLGASRCETLVKFQLPRAVPVIVSGLELSLIYAFLGVIAAEIVSGSNGLGSRMTEYANLFQADKFFAVLAGPDRDLHAADGRASAASSAGCCAGTSSRPADVRHRESRCPHGGRMALMPRRPNIIMVVLDDCGFAQLGCFGSEMRDAQRRRPRRRWPALQRVPRDGAVLADTGVPADRA